MKSKSPSQTTSATVPAWLDNQNQALVNRSVAESNKTYTPYTGERVAQYGADAQQGFDIFRGAQSKTDPLLASSSQSALDFASRAGRAPTAEEIQTRMNPFTQTVLDSQLRKLGEVQGGQTAALKRNAALTSGFGGSRNFLAANDLANQQSQQMSDVQGQGMLEAWNQAQQQYQNELAGLQAASGLTGQAAGNAQNITTTQGQNLLAAGDAQRQIEQGQLDTNYEDFLNEQNFNKEQLSWLSNILNPQSNIYSTQTSTQKGGGSSKLGQAVGIAASVAGMFSDERIKENIEPVGQLDNGLTVYKYNFIGEPQTQIGVMAQEVEKVNPEAVTENKDGIKMVDYDSATGDAPETKGYASGGGVFTKDMDALKQILASKLVVNPVTPRQLQTPEFQQEGDSGMGGLSSLMGSGGGKGGLMDFFKGTGNGGRTFGTPDQSWDWMDNFSMGAVKDKGYAAAGGFGPYRFAEGGAVDDRSKFRKLLDGELGNQVVDKVLFPVSDAILGGAERFGNYMFNPPSIQEEVKANLPKRVGWGDAESDAERQVASQEAQALKPAKPVDPNAPNQLSMADLPQGVVPAVDASQVGADPMQASQAAIAQRNAQLDALFGGAPAPQGAVDTVQVGAAQPMGASADPMQAIMQRILANMEANQTAPEKQFEIADFLSALGTGMLSSKGDFLDQLGAGVTSASGAKEKVKLTNAELRQKQMADMEQFLKTLAYVQQVKDQGAGSSGKLAMDAAELLLKTDKSTREQKELEEKIKQGYYTPKSTSLFGSEILSNAQKVSTGE
jgi:Chaperone of endosialidase